MADGFVEGNFLGLAEESGPDDADVIILTVPYELTSSYGQGSEKGPAAALAASAQVELYDPQLGADLPSGFSFHTATAWDGEGDTLVAQLDSIEEYVRAHTREGAFSLIFAGEHGLLPAVMRGISSHPSLCGDLSELTLVQVDAHADLRDELDGDGNSHACAARRSLDAGVGKILQMGIRAFSREEAEFIESDDRVETWLARDVLSLAGGESRWQNWCDSLQGIEGPVWLTIDLDGLDPAYVPSTGTPVPGGLAYWQVVETIEKVAAASGANLLGCDINEIVPDPANHVTEFTAAMLAAKAVSSHLARRISDDSPKESPNGYPKGVQTVEDEGGDSE